MVKNLRCFLSHFVFQHIRHVFAYSFLPSSLLRRLYYRRSSSITRRAKSHSRAHSHRSLTTESSSTGDTRHVASSPSSSPVLVHLCTVYTTYGFLIVGSRSLLRGNVRLSRNRAPRCRIRSHSVGPWRPAFSRRAFSANCGRLGLEIRFTLICNLSAV